jgi:DNA replication protein DnaC
MENNALLETYLRCLRLPTFAKNYRQFAQDATQNNLDYVRFLLALTEQEIQQREHNMVARRIKSARFPVLKELADFDFSAVPILNKAEILDLARGEYLQQRETILLIGNPGLGKTQPALCLKKKHICSS